MTAEQIIRQNHHSQNRPDCDYSSYPLQVAGFLTAAEQEGQNEWETYAHYKRQLNDIPLDPPIHTEILRRLAEIFDL